MSEWMGVFPDPIIAGAILARLARHAGGREFALDVDDFEEGRAPRHLVSKDSLAAVSLKRIKRQIQLFIS